MLYELLVVISLTPKSNLLRFVSCILSFFNFGLPFITKIDPSCEFSHIFSKEKLKNEVPDLYNALFIPVKNYMLSLYRECVINSSLKIFSRKIEVFINQTGKVVPKGWISSAVILPESTMPIVDLARRHINNNARNGAIRKEILYEMKDIVVLKSLESWNVSMSIHVKKEMEYIGKSIDVSVLAQKRYRFLHSYDLPSKAEFELEYEV
jgi:hypothetical protein